ncbi:hypothetical protein [Cupriavidus sp. D39]|uniref:hypothetical protein n=1 Tax=Cupriavidus sp. D39 TaxID=2997877 RepID=UPI003B63D7EA
MRAHAAAVGGVADHQVVQARIRGETELPQQVRGCTIVEVNALHQQRPLTGFQGGQVVSGEGALLELPAVAKVRHQARLDIVAIGQLEKRLARYRRHDSRYGLSNQQGFAVPDIAHESSWRHATQEGERRVRIDGAGGKACAYNAGSFMESRIENR